MQGRVIIPQRIDGKSGDIVAGKYTIHKVLGEGSFGCVYKVTDPSEKVMAMKLLRLWDVESSIRQPLTDRFEMEFRTGQIQSDFLVRSTDFGFFNGNPFIIMEFCPGGDLTSVIGKSGCDFSKIGMDILEGLGALHRNGKVHRDLKPENVLFRENGVAALTDFGISGDRNRRMTEKNIFGRPNQMFGTYAYMPPEQVKRLRGDSTILPTTDIFSFGVLMFQLITGELPFGRLNDHNDLVTYQKKGSEGLWNRPLLLSTQDGKQWESLISGCLAPDFKRRIQNVDEAMRLVPQGLSSAGYYPKPVQESVVPEELKTPEDVHISDCRLLITQGEEYGKVYNLSQMIEESDKWVLVAGREMMNDLVLKDFGELYVSRRHFTIEGDGKSVWVIRDGQWVPDEGIWRESANGTYVNSTRVSIDGYLLKRGDIISVGGISLKVL